MAEKTRPELDWDDEEVSKVAEDGEEDDVEIESDPAEQNESQSEDSGSKSSKDLCKVEDPTCEACQ